MDSIVSPLGFGTLLFLAVLPFWSKLPRLLRAIVIASACLLLVMTTPLGANALIRLHETGIEAAQACPSPAPTTVVLLSGGTASPPRDENDYRSLGATSLQRLFSAVELYQTQHATTFVIVGTSGFAAPDSIIMANLARQLGIPDSAVRVETRSLTTWQNARLTAELSPPVARRIWLVTSALHMSRSVYAFQQAGFEACAWPAYSLYRGPAGLGYLLPRGAAAAKAEDALHEIFGELAYRLGFHGRTDYAAAPEEK